MISEILEHNGQPRVELVTTKHFLENILPLIKPRRDLITTKSSMAKA
jgi:hypothetical protein